MAVTDFPQQRQVLIRRVNNAARVADWLDNDGRHGGGIFHFNHVVDDGGAGDAAVRIFFAEWAAIAGRREDMEEPRRQRFIDRLA